jgi:WD40 repeat protein
LEKDFGKPHNDSVTAICVSEDGDTVLTSDSLGTVNWWYAGRKRLVKQLSSGFRDENIYAMVIKAEHGVFFTSDNFGHVRMWSLRQEKVVKDFGLVNESWVFGMAI